MNKFIAMILLSFGLSSIVSAQSIKIFAASSTKLAMQEIEDEFKNKNPQDEITVIYSGTGKAYAQFTNGFEYDIFIAADSKYPQKIASDGDAITKPVVYAMGTVALFSHNEELIKMGLDAIKSDKVKYLSIANQKLAPYGEAALEILKNYGLEDEAKEKLVLGDNIAQSVQFVDSGAAEIGLVAFSLIKATKKESEYMLIEQNSYSPMKQAFVLTRYAKGKPLAQKFGDFLLSDNAQSIFEKYGFTKAKIK